MISYKEFYVWLEGFMTNRDWTEDLEAIKDKMEEVSDIPNDNKLYMGNNLGAKRTEIIGENWNSQPFKPVAPKIIFHNQDQDTVDKYERYD